MLSGVEEACESSDESDRERREEELEALKAFYGEEDFFGVQGAQERDDDDDVSRIDGDEHYYGHPSKWKIRVAERVYLELDVPHDYPSSSPPIPTLNAPTISQTRIDQLTRELREMWIPDECIAITWCEHCRSALEEEEQEEPDGDITGKQQEQEDVTGAAHSSLHADDAVITYVPPTSRFGQSIRKFQLNVIRDPANRRDIYRHPSYRPPKSGPSERLIAHVATNVTNQNQVEWVLAELLLNDNVNKVGRSASHNMFAYRYYDDSKQDDSQQVLVSDNDDDGEKGSGNKLGMLLEMCNARNVLVVVSRWYGGVKLGPSRFKYIAQVARDALEASGAIDDQVKQRGNSYDSNNNSNTNNSNGKKKNRGRSNKK